VIRLHSVGRGAPKTEGVSLEDTVGDTPAGGGRAQSTGRGVELWDGKRLENEVLACKAIAGSERTPALNRVEAAPAPISPRCPRCGEPMDRRRSRHGEFWGCSTFPRCRGTRPA